MKKIISLLVLICCMQNMIEPPSAQAQSDGYQALIDRAKVLVSNIPDTNKPKHLLTQALDSMAIVSVQTINTNTSQFCLCVDCYKIFDENTVFVLECGPIEYSGKVVITPNPDIFTRTNDTDLLASMLVGRLIVALGVSQRKNLKYENPCDTTYIDIDEENAWENQYNLYEAVHPEINNYECNCDNNRVFRRDGIEVDVDNCFRSFVVYNKCKKRM